jgi:two-component system OmpR family response regulator
MSTRSAPKILHIDDDPSIIEMTCQAFDRRGWSTKSAASIQDANVIIDATKFDVLVIDRTVPDGDGLNALRTWRQQGITTPAIILSALGDVDNRVQGLTSGAEDYLSKPFVIDELVARVANLLQRAKPQSDFILRSGPLELDLENHLMRRGSREESLLSRETRLLAYLMRHPDIPLTRPMLLRDVWNFNLSNETNVIDVHISKLRKKVDFPNESPLIKTIKGVGFIFSTAP